MSEISSKTESQAESSAQPAEPTIVSGRVLAGPSRKGVLREAGLNILIISLLSLVGLLTVFLFLPASSGQLDTSKEQIDALIDKYYIGQVPDEQSFVDGQLKGYVSALDDPYSDYMTGEDNDAFNDNLNERYEGIGVRFEENNQEVVIVETLPDGPAQEAGIMAGDVLVAVDGQPITNLDLDGIADLILGQAGTSVTLLVDRDGRELIFDIVRRKIFTPLITLKVEGDVGVINVLSFGENLDQEMLAVASDIVNNEQVDKLVLDLRNNGGGVLESAVDLASYFLEPDQVVAQEQTKEDLIEDKTVPKEVSLRRYPLVVLANNGTASASEIVAAALRDHRQVPLIGQTTYGKGLVQQVFRLQDGGYLRLTVAEWLTPNGQQINQKGLEPDMPTSPRQDTLDVVLENYDWEKQNLKQVAS